MLLVIPGSFLTFPITLFLPLALIWAVNDAWAFPINLAVVGNAQKLRALQPQDSRYNTSSRKLVSRTEVPEFESWEDYMDRYRRTIQDRHLLVDRLAKARKCVLDKVIDWSTYRTSFSQQLHHATAIVEFYRYGYAPLGQAELVGRSIKECVKRFELEDSLDEQQKRYFDSCVDLKQSLMSPTFHPLSEISFRFCIAYARNLVDPDLITQPDEEVKPLIDELNLAVEGRPRFSLKKQVDKVVEVFNDGFKKLGPIIRKSTTVSPVPGFRSPTGIGFQPI